MMRLFAFLFFVLVGLPAAQAQVAQCPTPAVGGSAPIASTPNCASQAFVTEHFPSSSTAGHLAAYTDASGQVLGDGGVLPSPGVTEVDTSGLATGGPITSTGTVTVTAAVKSDQTTHNSNSVAVTPAVQQYHPSAAKAWVEFAGGSSCNPCAVSYNVTSVARSGAGVYVITFTTSFAAASLVCVYSGASATAAGTAGNFTSIAAGSVSLNTFTPNTGSSSDPSNAGMVVCFGTQ